jgi:hypothetical protein
MEHAMSKNAAKIPAPKSPRFDLASRYAADSVDVVIYDPAALGEKVDTGMRVRIKSLYSKEARDAALGARSQLKLVDGEVDASDADFEKNLFEQTVAITESWWIEGESTDAIYVAGEWIACTPETVREVYSDPRTAWVQKQVQAAYLDVARFFGASKAS